MSSKSELEKIFLLTLVQNAKCYRITRQENPEFLGEFDGGAKTTSNSGVISFEYREIWERYASLTNKQTNKMNEISSDRKPNQRGKNLIFALNRYIAMKEGEKERGKTREITSFLSILSDFQQIQVKFYQLFATVMRWSLENFRKSYPNYRSFDEKGRKKLFCKEIAKKSQKGPKMSRKKFFFQSSKKGLKR